MPVLQWCCLTTPVYLHQQVTETNSIEKQKYTEFDVPDDVNRWKLGASNAFKKSRKCVRGRLSSAFQSQIQGHPNLKRSHIKHLSIFRYLEQAFPPAKPPIPYLPPEIWSQIFIYCLPSETYLVPSPHTAPLLLTHICSYWRHIAQSTLHLWSSLSFLAREDTPSRTCTDAWLTRSLHLPISLEIRLEVPQTRFEAQERVFRFLPNNHSRARWVNLRLSFAPGFDGKLTDRCMWALKQFPMRRLEVLEIDTDSPMLRVRMTKELAPKLKGVTLLDPKVDWRKGLEMNWDQITRFKSGFKAGAREVLELMRRAGSLEELDVCVGPSRRTSDLELRVMMKELKKLSIRHSAGESLDSFLRMLELPQLEELVITTEGFIQACHEPPWSTRELMTLVDRIQPSGLKRLYISGYDCNEQVIEEIVNAIPSLEEFHVMYGSVVAGNVLSSRRVGLLAGKGRTLLG
ncbi:hypothetical protein BDQ12DRAFT_708735 [Crucibulum laeve]|uniref:Uncharacterized protein n=1 Tax=Crucibulum laeve TaxID=68775 RepID=A0A5C3MU50_9AGAR|nr:hypothetical protein BDQ12DRAFT_708735 [Crucibulum laeve]